MATAESARSDLPKTGAGFCTTHWTVVLAAARGNDHTARDALARLCSLYWYPLYAFCRRYGRPPHDAEDLTQAFLTRLLEKNGLASVRPEHGRFRSFLLVSLKNFLAKEWERAHAQRRGGDHVHVSLDATEAEMRYALEPAEPLTPETMYERRWAFSVLEQTLSAVQREYAAEQKSDLFEQLRGFLPGGDGSVTRADLAAKRGVSVGAINVAIHRLRQRFGALLRKQVSETVSSEAEVTEEIRHLISILGC